LRSEEKGEKAAAIIRDAGGEIVGRTRLQKTAYLLDVAGFGDGFRFDHKHYGPHSEDLADAARLGRLFGSLKEVEKQADWGGVYSVYSVDGAPDGTVPPERRALAKQASEASALVLELVATAVFLAQEGHEDPWAETERRKPALAKDERLRKAKNLLARLRRIEVPNPLPAIRSIPDDCISPCHSA